MENFKNELKVWMIYFITLLSANFFHELGHCIPAWLYGYSAIPTLAKEYSFDSIPTFLTNLISFGGILNSSIFSVLGMAYFLKSSFKYSSSVMAGSIAMPSLYTLRFITSGRGHDGTEFQEAQSAIGFRFDGHFVDYLFIILLLIGAAIWILKSKPNLNVLGRFVIGIIASVIFIVALQTINNRIFDPIFSK